MTWIYNSFNFYNMKWFSFFGLKYLIVFKTTGQNHSSHNPLHDMCHVYWYRQKRNTTDPCMLIPPKTNTTEMEIAITVNLIKYRADGQDGRAVQATIDHVLGPSHAFFAVSHVTSDKLNFIYG